MFRRGDFWRAGERLEPGPEPAHWPSVVAIIPARNEAASINHVIGSHMTSDYPGAFSVILIDDHSTDDTAALAIKAVDSGRLR